MMNRRQEKLNAWDSWFRILYYSTVLTWMIFAHCQCHQSLWQAVRFRGCEVERDIPILPKKNEIFFFFSS